MDRRIVGLETEYGLTCTVEGRRRLSPDEVARAMFRSVVAAGRSSNVFLPNGGRLYLDVGNHPEYATAECDTLDDLLAQEAAGTAWMNRLVAQAQERLAAEGVPGTVYLFKNNVDSAGNSYGCHENYLVARGDDLDTLTHQLLPFLISRQLVCGAGRMIASATEPARYCVSQRAEVMWEGASSATTRSRPLINTRDEPHADSARFRRLHVIVGDSNMAPASTSLKVASTDLVLRALEAGARVPELSPLQPSRAIRQIAADPTCRAVVELSDHRTVTGLEMQRAYYALAYGHVAEHGPARPHDEDALARWDRVLTALETGRGEDVAGEVDWILKWRLIRRYAHRHGLADDDPRLRQLDMAYHDIDPARGLFYRAAARGAADLLDPASVERACDVPPATTRAHLRGAAVAAARRHDRDVTVDWSHVRLNEGAGHTVHLKDPLAAQDDRIERLVAALASPGVIEGSTRAGLI